MGLKGYHQKRDFRQTSEPKGRVQRRPIHRLFVVQEHAASHLHYDFRLELEGVLKSWAVPKGPSLDPSVKRLAVQVEDHPIEYAEFEGTIPKGQYGAGKVLRWDKGEWEPIGNAKAQLKKGHIKFILKGKKLQGEWHLIQLKDQPKNWLLFKSKDEYAQGAIPPQKKNKATVKDLTNVRKAKMPKRVYPQLATLVNKIPTGDGWLHEVKLDGYRFVTFIEKKQIKCVTRNQHDWTDKLTSIEAAFKKLALKNCILDGELVAFGHENVSDMQLLQNSFSNKKIKVFYHVFDLIYYDGYDLSGVPLIERKQFLKNLIPDDKSEIIRVNDWIVGNGKEVLDKCCQFGFEGVISKKADSLYVESRNKNWVKVKCKKSQEFVVCGFTSPKNTRQYFGSLVIGYYDKKMLTYCGHVGTGFNEQSLKEMHQLLSKIIVNKPHFEDIPRSTLGEVHWVKPKLVIEVEFNNITKDHIVRHPSFKGLRYDKDPREVTLEI